MQANVNKDTRTMLVIEYTKMDLSLEIVVNGDKFIFPLEWKIF